MALKAFPDPGISDPHATGARPRSSFSLHSQSGIKRGVRPRPVVGQGTGAGTRHDSTDVVALGSHPRKTRALHGNGSHIASLLGIALPGRSEEHTSELQSLMRISYAVLCLKKKKIIQQIM